MSKENLENQKQDHLNLARELRVPISFAIEHYDTLSKEVADIENLLCKLQEILHCVQRRLLNHFQKKDDKATRINIHGRR